MLVRLEGIWLAWDLELEYDFADLRNRTRDVILSPLGIASVGKGDMFTGESKDAGIASPQSSESKSMAGYLFALGSAAAIAATFIVRKLVSAQVKPLSFSVWWYGFAGLYAWFFALTRGEVRQAQGIRSGFKSTLALVLFNAVGAILYFTEIDMTHPALVSFFGRLRTLYIVLLGVLLMRERLNGGEWMGAGVTVLGTLVIAFRADATLNAVFLIALVENLMMAASTLAAKFAVRHLPPLILAGYRGLLISFLLGGYALLRGQWERISGRTLIVIAAGAFVGPFLGYVMRYAALARIDASKVAILTAVQPLFVIVYAVCLWSQWPTVIQFFGGMLTILGVILVFSARRARQRARVFGSVE